LGRRRLTIAATTQTAIKLPTITRHHLTKIYRRSRMFIDFS